MGYLILGSGGLGSALALELTRRNETFVLAGRHVPPGIAAAATFPMLDVDPLAFEALFTLFDELPSVIINTIGVLHDLRFMPERQVEEVDPLWLCESVRINAWPTLALGAYLSQRMTTRSNCLLITLSDLEGSLTANVTGEHYSYRMSKAALNMGVKTLALEWRERFPRAAVVALHPGPMHTPLRAPLLVMPSGDMVRHPVDVAPRLLDAIRTLGPADSGQLQDLDGRILPS
ncbi:SDR family oxidoreductase [Aeromonas molluscorum]|jgi:NAD(P)-dependent dehydrogenase (short-subunit alcohol dehydrogenase family)|uniref:SDR family oxidoreductase n=1 Tax=Aeromonas molluscorum TaxID=271417 RepID=UPI003F1D3C2B